jgi:hypothetical protein
MLLGCGIHAQAEASYEGQGSSEGPSDLFRIFDGGRRFQVAGVHGAVKTTP